jgi:hypothetical protein
VPAMTDARTGPPPWTSLRIACLIPAWLVLSIALVIYLYTLFWFSPAITSPGGCGGGSWWDAHGAAVLWVVALASIVAAWVCFGFALSRLRSRSRLRWWPWPVAAIACAAAGWPLLWAIPTAEWCPMG